MEDGTVGLLDDHFERAEETDMSEVSTKRREKRQSAFVQRMSERRASTASSVSSRRSSKRKSTMMESIEVHETKCCSCLFAAWIYVPVVLFTAAGFMGLISSVLYIALSDLKNFDLVLALTMFGVGTFAAIQVWIMGALADQIKFLRKIRHALTNQVEHLDGKVSGVEAENEEFQGNVSKLNEEQEKLEAQTHVARENVQQMRNAQIMLEEQNTNLKKEIQGYHEMTTKLQATTDEMTSNLQNLTVQIKEFDELRNQLSAQFGDDTELSAMLQQSMSTWNQMNSMFDESEYILLRQIQADIETTHLRRHKDSKGIPMREFRRFVSRLPPKYKAIWKTNAEFAFEQFDENSDGLMSSEEFEGIINRLVQAAQPEPAT